MRDQWIRSLTSHNSKKLKISYGDFVEEESMLEISSDSDVEKSKKPFPFKLSD